MKSERLAPQIFVAPAFRYLSATVMAPYLFLSLRFAIALIIKQCWRWKKLHFIALRPMKFWVTRTAPRALCVVLSICQANTTDKSWIWTIDDFHRGRGHKQPFVHVVWIKHSLPQKEKNMISIAIYVRRSSMNCGQFLPLFLNLAKAFFVLASCFNWKVPAQYVVANSCLPITLHIGCTNEQSIAYLSSVLPSSNTLPTIIITLVTHDFLDLQKILHSNKASCIQCYFTLYAVSVMGFHKPGATSAAAHSVIRHFRINPEQAFKDMEFATSERISR